MPTGRGLMFWRPGMADPKVVPIATGDMMVTAWAVGPA